MPAKGTKGLIIAVVTLKSFFNIDQTFNSNIHLIIYIFGHLFRQKCYILFNFFNKNIWT